MCKSYRKKLPIKRASARRRDNADDERQRDQLRSTREALNTAYDATTITLGEFSTADIFWTTVNEFQHFLVRHNPKIAFHKARKRIVRRLRFMMRP
ncbi:MAG: hypothetical protein DMF76_06210 [Acidobacteria bacterium]|nr:MAG: hypothetical protein DMF76_06210 [Acidobacteriota bacterium]